MPPVAEGRVNATGVSSTHTWFSTVQSNTGGVSGTTSIVNVNVSESLAEVLSSESVTFHVYSVGLCGAVGVPDSVSVEVNPTPSGSKENGDSL